MIYRYATLVVVMIFVLFAVFGLVLPLHAGHETGCPFSPVAIAICPRSLSHFEHWQAAFIAVFVDVLIVASAAYIFSYWYSLSYEVGFERERSHLRRRAVMRVPLFQELYARGILNRKEPYARSDYQNYIMHDGNRIVLQYD